MKWHLLALMGVLLTQGSAASQTNEVQALNPSNLLLGDQFGRSTAVSGDVALVGAPAADRNGLFSSGSVYVYRFDGTAWVEEQELIPSDAADEDRFGSSVSLSGDVALIGANLVGDTGLSETGAAYVFRFDGVSWVEEQKLVASDGADGDGFGRSVSLDGDLALIGARGGQNSASVETGAAYVFEFDGLTWNEQQKLAPNGLPGDQFGISVSLKGNLALIGAELDDEAMPDAGAAYIYRFDGVSWFEEQKLMASDAADSDRFSAAVAVDGDVALVGAEFTDNLGLSGGSAYVFRFNGTTWVEEQKLLASDGGINDRMGTSVALRGDVALVGAQGADSSTSNSGAAYVYVFDGLSWLEEEKLETSLPISNAFFGGESSLSFFDRTVFVGARHPQSAGSAFVFEILVIDCNQNGIHDPDEIAAGAAPDCDLNGVPDACDLLMGALDCDGNGIPDQCDLLAGATDCDGNGLLDSCDLAGGANPDPVPPAWSDNPGDQLVATDSASCFATVTWLPPTPSDDCLLVDVMSTHVPGDSFPLGTTVVTYTAIDLGGNLTETQFSVEVFDAEGPQLAGVSPDLVVSTDLGQCGASVTWLDPMVTDNCSTVTLVINAVPGDFFPVGVSTVTYSATDVVGNNTFDSFTVTVIDDESPTVTPSADLLLPSEAGLCGAMLTIAPPMLGDNCPGVSVTNDFTGTDDASGTYPVGETTVMWTATDAAGNTTTATQLVTIEADPTDCNLNGVPDVCDIATGTSMDMNGNEIPDECESLYIRGDANGDLAVDLGDPVYVLGFLFNNEDPPGCLDSGDSNDDLAIDLADAVYLLGFLFNGGAPPPPPFGVCGVSPNDSLGCAEAPCP